MNLFDCCMTFGITEALMSVWHYIVTPSVVSYRVVDVSPRVSPRLESGQSSFPN